MLVLFGCGTSSETALSVDGESESILIEKSTEPSLEQQIKSGRDGKTDRLVLRDQEADTDALAMLSADDTWLEAVMLDSGVIDDAQAITLASLPNLVHLRLRRSPVGDQTLEQLAGCASLQILNLPQSKATADGIAMLKKLASLRSLRIGGENLNAETANAVASLSQLRSLHLIGVPIDDQGLREIARMPELTSLFIDDSEVSEEGWDWLFDNHANLHVHVNQRHHDRLSDEQRAQGREKASGEAATRFSKDHASGEHSS